MSPESTEATRSAFCRREEGNFIPTQVRTRSWQRGLSEMLWPEQIFISHHTAPQGQGTSPNLPYLWDGSALYFSSYTSRWRKSPKWSSIPITSFLPRHVSPFTWQIDGLLGCLLTAPGTRDSKTELAELISTVSLFRPALCRWFSSLTSPSLPLPTEELQPVGRPSFLDKY